jgi:CDP-glycerol glycerophosphotransferase
MPNYYDPYEVLNLADCLITDYSSVFYDFANSGKKVVLFPYDEEEYLLERGIYTPLDSLPFPKVYDVDSLYLEMVSPKAYDDTEFRRTYCTYDNPHATENLLKRIYTGEKLCKECSVVDTSKENVLMFGGNLAKNGITTAMVNLLHHVDTSNKRYYVTFQQDTLKPDPLRVLQIPSSINIFPMPCKPQYTPLEALSMVLYYKFNMGFALQYIDRLCEREVAHLFTGLEVSHVVQYEGYGKNMVHLFKHFNCDRSIFVHNNMVEELANKNIQHRKTLEVAYNSYNHVACVTTDLLSSTESISHRKDNLVVVNNYHDYLTILEKSKQPIAFDVDTISNVSLDTLNTILSSDSVKVINIGRFSPEKGHDMLIHAFEKFYTTHKDAYLIIIGGYGEEYHNTMQLVNSSPCSSNIVVIKSVSNPMPILAKCDVFVLSSRYEGLGLTLLEADTLHIPTISTNVCGASGFMTEHDGYLVEPSIEGIHQGLEDFTQGKVSAMCVDFDTYNHNAISQFEDLLNG